MKRVLFFILMMSTLACEKDITDELFVPSEKAVVEGFIETYLPPIIMVSRNVDFYDTTLYTELQQLLIHDLKITLNNGSASIILDEYCAEDLSADQQNTIGSVFNSNFSENICIYSTDNPAFFGEAGKTYSISFEYKGKRIQSSTTIPDEVPSIDLSFLKINGNDTLGTILIEHENKGDYYRVFTERIGRDVSYIPSSPSTFKKDAFTIEINRGSLSNTATNDNFNEEASLFNTTDNIVVKFCTLDQNTYDFWNYYDGEKKVNANPFATPSTTHSTIENGLGVWTGYNAIYDTLFVDN